MEDLSGQSLGHGHRVVAQEFDDLGQLPQGRGMDTPFPIPDRLNMDAKSLGNLGLHQVKLQTPPLDVLTDGLRVGWRRLSAFPPVGMWVTQSLDLQVAKWQRT